MITDKFYRAFCGQQNLFGPGMAPTGQTLWDFMISQSLLKN